MTKRKKWRVIDYGPVDASSAHEIEFACLNCMTESLLPVNGTPLAQLGIGLVFATSHHAMPTKIECRWCRKRYECGEVA